MSKPERPPNSFSVVWGGNDPDLPYPPDPGRPGCVLATETHDELDAAWRYVQEQATAVQHLLVVTCFSHGCGPRRSSAAVADVLATPQGLLYTAPIVLDHNYAARRRAAAGHDPLPARWTPNYQVRVRDLIDRDDLDHVPLRWQCPRRKVASRPLDPALLLAEAQKAKSSRARRITVGTLLPVS